MRTAFIGILAIMVLALVVYNRPVLSGDAVPDVGRYQVIASTKIILNSVVDQGFVIIRMDTRTGDLSVRTLDLGDLSILGKTPTWVNLNNVPRH